MNTRFIGAIPTITPLPSVGSRYAGVRLPVLRIDAVNVTRDLPPTVSNSAASVTTNGRPTASLRRPTIDIPSVEIDYPEVDVPSPAEFAEASNKNTNNNDNKKKSTDDNNGAKNLAGKLAPPVITQQPQQPLIRASSFERSQTTALQPAPAALPAPPVKPAEPSARTVSLPFVGTVPLPSNESLALASTTAVTATFVAVLGKAAFEASLEGIKPVLRILAIRYKKLRKRSLNDEELQLEFAFNAKRKGKRTIGEMARDLKEYFSENFFDDLIG